MRGEPEESWRLAMPDDPLAWPAGHTLALGSADLDEPECANPYAGGPRPGLARRLLDSIGFALWYLFARA